MVCSGGVRTCSAFWRFLPAIDAEVVYTMSQLPGNWSDAVVPANRSGFTNSHLSAHRAMTASDWPDWIASSSALFAGVVNGAKAAALPMITALASHLINTVHKAICVDGVVRGAVSCP